MPSGLPRMTKEIDALLGGLSPRERETLSEIRIYAGRPVVLSFGGRSRVTDMPAPPMNDLLAVLSGYALYSVERQMAKGYIPLPGGHRAGVCGRMTRAGDRPSMAEVSSVCIRVSRQADGASREIRPLLLDGRGRMRRVLLLGPPGCGKTTVLRDAALYLSDEMGLQIAVADEREELFAALEPGRGLRLDVLLGEEKAAAITMLLRSMAPQGIVTDEIGSPQDAHALADAARCGVGILASAHADGFEDMRRRPALGRLCSSGAFERFVLLGERGSVLRVADAAGEEIRGDGRNGELGSGSDGDDRCERRRLSAL